MKYRRLLVLTVKHAAPSSVTTEGVTTGTIAIEGECRKSESIKSLETQFVKGPVSPKNCLPDDFVESDLPMTTDCVAVGTAIAGRPRTDPYTKNYLTWLLPISRLTG